ncbi:PfkB family carbohydrate kinase [Streptomyces sp. NPDC060194]|uniref:sugar kinase n=1 Tax=Streptomyces sp. NPDC060194 TaxID=3347069 RepID=UPI003654B759
MTALSRPAAPRADAAVDVVCAGESMVTFRPTVPGRLADVPAFERGIGGAESNVACTLAAAGHRTRWVSRVGADGFGDHLLAAIAAYGVDVTAVARDPRRPTGIYFRTAGERATAYGPTATGTDAARADSGPTGSVPAAATASARPADGPGADRAVPGGADPARPAPEQGLGTAAGRPEAAPSATAGEPLAEVAYYRAGSAASAMSPATMDRAALLSGRVLHLSGITAALSADCLALLYELTGPEAGRPLLSFDVNYRANLWSSEPGDVEAADAFARAEAVPTAVSEGSPGRTAPFTARGPRVLLELARRADLVFVGEDEAEAAWGVAGGPGAVRAVLPEPAVLVVKQGADGATAYDGEGGGVHEPAPRVDVTASVGAGDAFAAGFLSATLRGLPLRERLRHGHLTAAATLTTAHDAAPPPPRAEADRLVALPDADWAALHITPATFGGRP